MTNSNSPMDPADFASLLEREPAPDRIVPCSQCRHRPGVVDVEGPDGTEWFCLVCTFGVRGADGFLHPECPIVLVGEAPGQYEYVPPKTGLRESLALNSAAEHIKALEGYLQAIQGAAAYPYSYMEQAKGALNNIQRYCREALDPHKPWCRDENHAGACISDSEERNDGE